MADDRDTKVTGDWTRPEFLAELLEPRPANVLICSIGVCL
jgi:hypothetical protein